MLLAVEISNRRCLLGDRIHYRGTIIEVLSKCVLPARSNLLFLFLNQIMFENIFFVPQEKQNFYKYIHVLYALFSKLNPTCIGRRKNQKQNSPKQTTTKHHHPFFLFNAVILCSDPQVGGQMSFLWGSISLSSWGRSYPTSSAGTCAVIPTPDLVTRK